MKIAFLGQKNFCDFFKIGGFESFVRRLAIGLAKSGSEIDYILYDSPPGNCLEPLPGLRLHYFNYYEEAITKLLSGAYDHVFRVWLSRRERLKYLLLRSSSPSRTRWHHLFLIWPDSIVKRSVAVFEAVLNSRNGLRICVSPRQYAVVGKYFQKSCHFLPPVPEAYFACLNEKKVNGKINVTFLGNLTKDKFIEEIIFLFNKFHDSDKYHDKYHFAIYGTHDHLNKHSVTVHEWLNNQQNITYVNINMETWSIEVDHLVKKVLQDTDVFVQPYRTLNNTLDMPLLLLEAMAALCPVITTPVGSVQQIYGDSQFLIPVHQFLTRAENLLKNLEYEEIMAERKRIDKRNKELGFNMANIIDQLLFMLMSR